MQFVIVGMVQNNSSVTISSVKILEMAEMKRKCYKQNMKYH